MTASVCLLTAYDSNYRELAAVSVPGMTRLAESQGYALRVLERQPCGRRGGWIKIEPIIEALAGPFDYVLWVDVDTLIVRPDLDIRHAVRPSTELQMVWHDPAQPSQDPAHFNTGVMLIRNSDWGRDFFQRVWERGPIPHRWNDQATIHHLLGYDAIAEIGPDRHDVIANNPVSSLDATWNSIPGVAGSDDPVIWHFAGMPMAMRWEQIRALTK